jgi:hypothetical protein
MPKIFGTLELLKWSQLNKGSKHKFCKYLVIGRSVREYRSAYCYVALTLDPQPILGNRHGPNHCHQNWHF